MVLSFVCHYFMLHVGLRYVHSYTGPLPQSECIVQEDTSTFPRHSYFALTAIVAVTVERISDRTLLPNITSAYKLVFLFAVLSSFA
jgi:hypothetical protein